MNPPLHRSRSFGRLSKVVLTLTLLAGALTARLAWLNFTGHERQQRVEDLFINARLGRASEVRRALDLGVDPNSTEPPWPPPVHSYWQDLELALGLTRPKVDKDARFLIEVAAQNANHPEVAELLLDRGATPTFKAVADAANLGSARTLQLLLDHGGPFESGRETAMWGALSSGSADAVRLLLEHGAHIPADWDDLTLSSQFREGANPTKVRKLITGALAKDPSRLW